MTTESSVNSIEAPGDSSRRVFSASFHRQPKAGRHLERLDVVRLEISTPCGPEHRPLEYCQYTSMDSGHMGSGRTMTVSPTSGSQNVPAFAFPESVTMGIQGVGFAAGSSARTTRTRC